MPFSSRLHFCLLMAILLSYATSLHFLELSKSLTLSLTFILPSTHPTTPQIRNNTTHQHTHQHTYHTYTNTSIETYNNTTINTYTNTAVVPTTVPTYNTMKRPHDDIESAHESGEESDADEESVNVPPYDAAAVEGDPDSPVFRKEFKQVEDLVEELTKLIFDPLEQFPDREDAIVQGLLKEAKHRTQASFPQKIKIAIVGAMKAGKIPSCVLD